MSDGVMKWTSTLPTEPGYYWLRHYFWPDCEALQEEPIVVELEKSTDGELMMVELYRETAIAPMQGEWYGPLMPPL